MVKTFKYTGTDPFEIPALSVRVGAGETFEVPDEFAARFESEPDVYKSSASKNPDVVPDPTVVAAVTGPVPTIDSAPAA